MGAGDVAGDGQAQPAAAGLQVAALVEAVEGAEGFLAPRFGNARAVVIDQDLDMAARIGCDAASPCCACHA